MQAVEGVQLGEAFGRWAKLRDVFRAIRNSRLVAIVRVKYAGFAWNIHGSCLKSWPKRKCILFILKTVLVWKPSLTASFYL